MIKQAGALKSTESSNKQFYNCFVAVTSFKICLTKSNKWVSFTIQCVLQKWLLIKTERNAHA